MVYAYGGLSPGCARVLLKKVEATTRKANKMTKARIPNNHDVKLNPPHIMMATGRNILGIGDRHETTFLITGKKFHGGTYQKPHGTEYGETFVVKTQADNDTIFVYDQSRNCLFYITIGQVRFEQIVREVRMEPA